MLSSFFVSLRILRWRASEFLYVVSLVVVVLCDSCDIHTFPISVLYVTKVVGVSDDLSLLWGQPNETAPIRGSLAEIVCWNTAIEER